MLRGQPLPIATDAGIMEIEIRENFPEIWLWSDLYTEYIYQILLLSIDFRIF